MRAVKAVKDFCLGGSLVASAGLVGAALAAFRPVPSPVAVAAGAVVAMAAVVIFLTGCLLAEA